MEFNIKNTIKKYGLTSVEVANRMGISKTAISFMINGNPTVESLERIADAIGCDVTEFFVKPEKDGIYCPNCGCRLCVRLERE